MLRKLSPFLLPALGVLSTFTAVIWALTVGCLSTPLFWVGGALALAGVFGLVWAFGIRYPDVGWMLVLTGLLTLSSLSLGDLGVGWHPLVSSTIDIGLRLAQAAFVLTFFRLQIRSAKLEVGFIAAVTCFAALVIFLADSPRVEFSLLARVPCLVGAVVLGYAAVHGVTELAPLPPKRRLYGAAVVVATVCTAAFDLIRIRLAPGPSPVANFAFVAALASVLLADLVVFHREYLKTKSQRIVRSHSELQIEAVNELVSSVRSLLPKEDLSASFGEFAVAIVQRLVSSDEPHGDAYSEVEPRGFDWTFTWRSADEQRVILGEVSGSGGDLALGGAAVTSFLKLAHNRGLSLSEALRFVNNRLLAIFDKRITSTAMVLSLGRDGSVELANCGSHGFFILSRDGAKHLGLNSTPLGISPDLEIAISPVPLDDEGLVVAATDGVVTGASGVRRVLAFFDTEIDLELTPETVRDQFLSLASRPPGADDQTLLIVYRQSIETQVVKSIARS